MAEYQPGLVTRLSVALSVRPRLLARAVYIYARQFPLFQKSTVFEKLNSDDYWLDQFDHLSKETQQRYVREAQTNG